MHDDRVGILSNTWRASEYTEWDANLDPFWAEFLHGPKMKFAKLGLLSNFD